MVDQAAALKRFSRVGVLALALICGIALAGWTLGVPVLASIVPGWPRMALIVILCFLLCGAGVLELTRPATGGYLDLARIAAAGMVLAVGGATLLDFVLAGGFRGASAGTTNLFGPTLGRPSPATAFNFLVAAAALMVPRGDRRGLLYSGLVATGLVVTAFDFVGYAYDIAALSRGPTISTMSLPTMISFILLFVAMLLARPQAGWIAIVFADNSGGNTARRLLPAVLVLPFVVNGILVLAYRSRPFEALFGFAILAVVTSAGLAIVTVIIAQWLAAGEERTSLIVETALDAVIGIDRHGAITGWNRQAEAVFGWAHKEALGRRVEQTIMPERFRDAHKRGLTRYLDTGEARVLNKRIELTGLHRNGREFPVELSITPVHSGGIVGFTAFVRDITERKGAEARLQSQLQRLALLERITHAVGQRQDMRSIFQTVVRTLEDRLPADFVCVCSYDPSKNQLTVSHIGVNGAALGREHGMVEQAIIPAEENGLARCLKGTLVYEPDIAEIDFPFPRRLARQGLRSLVITPLMIEENIFGVLLVARLKENAFVSADCEFLNQLGEHAALAAHQAQLRQGLEEAYENLKQTQQTILQQERLGALGQMASGIAHDINNAISPVAIYTQSLLERETSLSPQILKYLETVGRVIKDVSATVSRMRDFYRRGDSDNELQATNLNTLIPQVVELTKARWSDMPQQRGIVIKIVTQLEADLPLVMANAVEIREAATNLIFNAVDAMPKGGGITIRTSSWGGPSDPGQRRVRFEVEDSGVGMDESTRRRCLEPFFTTKGERGTGLGLAMVYGTAQRHKAALDIDSTLGKGTCMRLEFAATQTEMERPRQVKASEIQPLRLLLVDDDPAVLDSTQLVLELDGHAVVTADGGQPGIDALRAAKNANQLFDLIITDLGMPYVDGNQVARAAKELFPSATVVLLTGWGRKMGDDDGQPANVDHVLPKPLDLDELRTVFARHARR